MKSLAIPKYAVGTQIFLTILIVGLGTFFVAMGIFASQASVLECEGATCSRSEIYPFGISFREEIPAITHASTRAKSGRRGVSLNLALFHEDDSATEYPGVGTNGDRAAEVAESINLYLASPTGPKTFELRPGSKPFGIGLLVLGLLALLLAPSTFTSVRFTPVGDKLEIRVGRWPRRTTLVPVELSSVQEVQVGSRTINDQTVYELFLPLAQAPPIALGSARRTQEAAVAQAKAIDDQIMSWRERDDRPST